MTDPSDLETRLADLIAQHERDGRWPAGELTANPAHAPELEALANRYLELAAALDAGGSEAAGSPTSDGSSPLPVFDGFRTIERLGSGGMGEVYKLQDLKLDRIVAAKVLRRDPAIRTSLAGFLREAKSLALFSHPSVVQVFEFRADATPPVIIMEFVEGFELGRLASSLEFRQRAAILRDVCAAIQRAHDLGIQHRDLKPANIMLDARLSPKILDFGLAAGDPRAGHLRGTLHYLAPEQLDPSQPIDARTDVYALGVILYELTTGTVPYPGASDAEVASAIRAGQPRLPAEIDPKVPEALQRIALKAMAARPEDRYGSARELAQDLERYLDGRPVDARPPQYASTLAARVRPHREQIDDWTRLKLIYPHEATRLHAAYQALDRQEDDWIATSRSLSYSQIALYLGAFFLLAGSLFYFAAHRMYDAVRGTVRPFFILGLPFLGLNAAARWLYREDRRAVAVAFYLAGVSLLPLFLLIWFHETGWWIVPKDAPNQILASASISNRQLQITILIACLWSGWLALRTRTGALSTVFTLLTFFLVIAILGDFGLMTWLDDGRYDRLALHLAPIVPLYAAAGYALDRRGQAWFARPLFIASGVSLVAVMDLFALDGRMLHSVGVSLDRLQSPAVTNPTLIDTLAALSLSGALFYGVAWLVERYGTAATAAAGLLLFTIAPFSMLEPLAYLSETAQYSPKVDWLYLALAIGIALISHQRQRRSFYYAGVVNTGVALYFIADHRQWFDKPAWAVALVVAGLAALGAGLLLDTRQRRQS
ncbi:MAG TPA: protein kinase [Vicinamibacterales bacterium]|nr:protein kinase [Vicinamibacterales bacterium]